MIVAPGSFFGPAGEATCGSRWCRRSRTCARATAINRCACSAAFRPAQRPERGSASTVPVRELRRNSSPFAPLSSLPLTTSPSGSVISVPAVT